MPKKLGNLSVGNAVDEGVGGEAVPVAVRDHPLQPQPPPSLENPIAQAFRAERLALAPPKEWTFGVALGHTLHNSTTASSGRVTRTQLAGNRSPSALYRRDLPDRR
jgi:hypothetical protein